MSNSFIESTSVAEADKRHTLKCRYGRFYGEYS